MSQTVLQDMYRRANFLFQLSRDLERFSVRTPDAHLLRTVLRRLGELFHADVAIQIDIQHPEATKARPFRLALNDTGKRAIEERRGEDHEGHLLQACERILNGKAVGDVPRTLLVLAIEPDDRTEAVLGLIRFARSFSKEDLHFGQEVANLVSDRLVARERERERHLRERLSAKIFSELRPKDVLYQILHGLRRLFHYDHSGSVLLLGPDGRTLTVEAEIVTWTKAKSDRIDQRVILSAEAARWIANESSPLLVRDGVVFPSGLEVPPDLREPILETAPGSPVARSMLIGILRRKEQALGVIQLLGHVPSTFTAENRVTLEKFLPLASATVLNSELYEAQHHRMVTAERRVGLADLARAISHDLNNAFGVIVPLLQAVQRDVESGTIDRARLIRDLEVIEHYTAFSSRIFQGMLSIGLGEAEPYAWRHLGPILESSLAMVEPHLETRRIGVVRRIDPDVPSICLRAGEMEQLILNLVYNARDAMPNGGTLEVTARAERGGARVELTDTGTGIPSEIREKIFEPFFTTKQHGSGLGLDICRSIVWEYGGTLELVPAPERGTTASFWLPRSTDRIPRELREAGDASLRDERSGI